MGKERIVWGFDTETYLEDGQMKPMTVQFYTEDIEDGKIFIEVFREDGLKELAKLLKSRKLRNSILAGFNIAFDLTVLSNLGFEVKVFVSNGRFIMGRVVRHKHYITVYDLKNLLPYRRLSELAKAVGMEKMERPLYLGTVDSLKLYLSNETYRNYFREYALNDARICYHAFRKLMTSVDLKKLKFTIGSNAMSLFRSKYVDVCFPSYPNEVEGKIRMAYRGGRTEVFVRGSPDKPLNYYDVNSLYPYVMYAFRYPYCLNNSNGRFVRRDSVNLDFEGVAKALVVVDHPIPPLGVKRQCRDGFTRLVFPEGKVVDWFTYPELRYLEEGGYGKVVKTFEAFEWRIWFYPFEDYVSDLAKLKEIHESDKFLRTLYKMLMNSLYGKFGEWKAGEWVVLKDSTLTVEGGDGRAKPRKYVSPVIAAYVTAYARLYLHSLMMKVPKHEVIYCDTDSIITPYAFPDTLVHPKELGKLKHEGSAKPFESTFIRSKFYIFGDRVKMKGFTLEGGSQLIKDLIRSKKNALTQEVILKPLEARRRRMKPLTYVVITKTFNLSPDFKRVYERDLQSVELLEDYTESHPIKLYEGGL